MGIDRNTCILLLSELRFIGFIDYQDIFFDCGAKACPLRRPLFPGVPPRPARPGGKLSKAPFGFHLILQLISYLHTVKQL